MATDTPNAEFRKIERQPKLLGLQNRGKREVKCADCGELLMVFQITKNNDDIIRDGGKAISTQVLVDCGFCQGLSYVQTIDGQFYPGAPNDQMVFEPLEAKDARVQCDIYFKAWPKI